ncbi:hypothetical protein ABT215_12830 [Streptomyces sp900105755]|uniref:hypothetical protein n=1 Tax=Streptomyces sp. 900105755 TaxID=3154389 RepID=UPI0033211D15
MDVEAIDYCQCNRGPVIGIVSYTDTRLQFFSLEDWHARTHHDAADLRCVDCLADAAMDIANGVVRERMRESARQRGEEMDALMRRNEMRKQAGLPLEPEWIDPDPEGNAWPVGGAR